MAARHFAPTTVTAMMTLAAIRSPNSLPPLWKRKTRWCGRRSPRARTLWHCASMAFFARATRCWRRRASRMIRWRRSSASRGRRETAPARLRHRLPRSFAARGRRHRHRQRAFTTRASVKLVLIQRSRGYDWRPSLSVGQIDAAIEAIHSARPDVCVMVDDCYGEFTDVREPRADLLAGSLIKNPGGGLAPTGGYVAGKRSFVEKVACRLTSPASARKSVPMPAVINPSIRGSSSRRIPSPRRSRAPFLPRAPLNFWGLPSIPPGTRREMTSLRPSALTTRIN